MINHFLCSLTPQFVHLSPNHLVWSRLWTRLSHVGRCFTFDQALCEVLWTCSFQSTILFEHGWKTALVLFSTATSSCTLIFVGYYLILLYWIYYILHTSAFYWYLLVFSEYLTIWSEHDQNMIQYAVFIFALPAVGGWLHSRRGLRSHGLSGQQQRRPREAWTPRDGPWNRKGMKGSWYVMIC